MNSSPQFRLYDFKITNEISVKKKGSVKEFVIQMFAMNEKGGMKGISFIIGLIVLLMGLIPLLNNLNVLHIPFNGVTGTILYALLIIAGLIYLVNSLY
jgi:hypothetical protein